MRWELSACESSRVQVLAAPKAAWAAMLASMHLRWPTSDDIARTTGGSFSRPRASVTCDSGSRNDVAVWLPNYK